VRSSRAALRVERRAAGGLILPLRRLDALLQLRLLGGWPLMVG
jgi:hypothetical protein